MSVDQSLAANKQAILDSWFQATIDSYPSDTASFLNRQKDPFANPVGQTTHQSLDALLDALIADEGREAMTPALDPVMRIRAVQSFAPSAAISFVFALKEILRRQLGRGEAPANGNALDRRIDEMAMAAFDIFVACREKIFELKATESRNQFFGSLKRAGLISEQD